MQWPSMRISCISYSLYVSIVRCPKSLETMHRSHMKDHTGTTTIYGDIHGALFVRGSVHTRTATSLLLSRPCFPRAIIVSALSQISKTQTPTSFFTIDFALRFADETTQGTAVSQSSLNQDRRSYACEGIVTVNVVSKDSPEWGTLIACSVGWINIRIWLNLSAFASICILSRLTVQRHLLQLICMYGVDRGFI